MRALCHYCRGESHKSGGKACQDFAITVNDRGLTVAIVCDGHGGDRYFRSDIGARIAAETAAEAIKSFIKLGGKSLFDGKAFTTAGPIVPNDGHGKETAVDKAFRQLFSSIIAGWRERIAAHAEQNPPTSWELEHVRPEYLKELASSEDAGKIYGCTLLAFARTPRFWFAFQIGDGKCISFQSDPLWREPVTWDDRCFLNKTTSLCDDDALNEFRYCYEGDGKFPAAVFLGSDGMDDSFGDICNLVNFYIQFAKEIVRSETDARASLERYLPELSRIGSRDDMSVACAFSPRELKRLIPKLLEWQISQAEMDIESSEQMIAEYSSKADCLSSLSDDKSRIEYGYAQSDLTKALEMKSVLDKKLSLLIMERDEMTNSKN